MVLKKQRALIGPALYRSEYATGRKIALLRIERA